MVTEQLALIRIWMKTFTIERINGIATYRLLYIELGVVYRLVHASRVRSLANN